MFSTRSIRPLRALALALVLSTTTACAGLQAKNAHIEAETTAYVFDEDPAVVLAAARQLLFEQGYIVNDSGPNALETDWQVADSGKQRSRMLIQVTVSEQGTRLSANGAHQGLNSKGEWYGGGGHPDAYFVLDVIEQLDADAANRIRTGADAARDAARE